MSTAKQPRENSPLAAGSSGGVYGEQQPEPTGMEGYAITMPSDGRQAAATVCDDASKGASETRAQSARAKPETSPIANRGGKGVVVSRPRDRAAEKAMQKARYSLALPKCGAAVESITRRVKGFRVALEAAVVEARGGITLADACAINTACAAERHLSLCASWLARDKDGKLTPSERLAHAKGMLEGSERRDKAVASLRLPGGATEAAGGNPSDFYASLNKHLAETTIEQPAAMPEKPTPASSHPEPPDCPAPPPAAPPAAPAPTAAAERVLTPADEI